jgi:arsenite/tail-anchored protein-transporting ATPase
MGRGTNVFFMGKGGVGKSTSAALHAIFLSERGYRVILVSLDPAHNQSDIFEKQFSDKVRKVSSTLFVIEVDEERWIKTYLKDVRQQINKTYAYLTAFNLDNHFKVIKHSPGLEEYALLLAYQDIRKRYADFDFLIFDMPPTALSLKFFSLPSLSLIWLNHLLALRHEIIRKRDLITKIKLIKKEYERDKLLNKINTQRQNYQDLKNGFENMDRVRIHLVLNPDKLSHAESMRIIERLKELCIQVSRIICNKVEIGASGGTIEKLGENSHICFPVSRIPLIGFTALQQFLKENIDAAAKQL